MGSVYRPTRLVDGVRVKYRHWRIAWKDEHGERVTEKAFKDKAASQALLRRREADVERKKAGLSVVTDGDRQRTISDALDAYAAELTRLDRDPRHVANVRNSIQRCAAWCKWTTIGSIRPDRLSAYLAHRAAGGSSARTVNSDRDYVCWFCTWMVTQDWLAENPVSRVPRSPSGGKHRRKVRRAYTPAEMDALLRTAPPKRALVYRLAATSGLRRVELTRIEWRDADLERGLWTLRPEVSKNAVAWKVPMSEEAAAVLRSLPPGGRTDRIFKSLPDSTTVNADLERAGVCKADEEGRQVDFHAFRYYFCSQLARHLPVQKVRVLMRHQTLKLTCDLYLQLGLDDLAEDVWSLPPLLGTFEPRKQLTPAPAPGVEVPDVATGQEQSAGQQKKRSHGRKPEQDVGRRTE